MVFLVNVGFLFMGLITTSFLAWGGGATLITAFILFAFAVWLFDKWANKENDEYFEAKAKDKARDTLPTESASEPQAVKAIVVSPPPSEDAPDQESGEYGETIGLLKKIEENTRRIQKNSSQIQENTSRTNETVRRLYFWIVTLPLVAVFMFVIIMKKGCGG
jgi:hypothetical protein